MKADLSRGHRPDRKRGKAYNRVLLQQGRLLLDSDVAALSDSLNAQVHGLGQEVVGEGSTNHGFLITPGPQFAQFDTLGAVTRDASSHALFRVSLDHGRKYLGRLPALYLDGTQGWGKVSIAVRRPITATVARLRIWARIPTSTQLTVEAAGIPAVAGTWPATVTGSDAVNFKAYDVTLPAGGYSAQTLTLSFTNAAAGAVANREAFIGFIEGQETAGAEPRFWVRKGHYRVGGLGFELEQDGRFPGVTLPTATGAGVLHGAQAQGVSNGQRYVAYLEGWERLVTQVEDAGLLEQALGGTLDTSVRTRPVGQVKLARCNDNGALTPEAMLAAFRQRKLPAGTLTLSTAAQVTAQDPCAIPEVAGYTGGDNRLYRFEVHDAGNLGNFSIKWSRNNGAELFPIVKSTASGGATRLELLPGADLRDGDLVELLDETVELGDAVQATVDATGLTPSQRAKGPLYLVREVLDAPGQVELLNSAGSAVLLSHDLTAVAPSKLRRWHGLLKPADGVSQGGGLVYTVDGIEVKLAGPGGNPDLFRTGDYWQYEARRLYANDNGTWVASPHGPERFLAPLALMKFNGTGVPVELVRWYAGHFSPLAALGGDDVAFDGNRVGSASDTVQGALDELFLRQGSGACGHAELYPDANPTDDAARLLNLIQTKLPKGGVINLRPGVYYLRSKLSITNLNVELRGCPEAVMVSDLANTTTLSVGTGGALTLAGLTVFCKTTAPALVEVSGNASLSVKECGLFHVGTPGAPGIAILTPGLSPAMYSFFSATYVVAYPPPVLPEAIAAPSVEVEDSILIAKWGVAASNLDYLGMRGTVSYCAPGCGIVEVSQQLARAEVSGCSFATDFPTQGFDSLRTQEPSAVAAYARTLLETVQLPSPTGTAFHVQHLFESRVEHSSFFAFLGVAVQLARQLTLQGNSYTGRNGMRLDNVVNSRILEEYIKVDGPGNTDSPVGILVVRSAINLTISGCNVRAENLSSYQYKHYYGLAIVLGTRQVSNDPQERRLTGVLVQGNRVHATSAGVFIRGWSTEDVAPAQPDRISILGNHIQVDGRIGVHYRGIASTSPRPPEVLISDNQIDVAGLSTYYDQHGIFLEYGSASVRGNTIHMRNTGGVYAYGVLLSIADNCVIDGNTFLLSSENPGGSGALCEGLLIYSSSNVKVCRNVFRASGYTRTFYADMSSYLWVEDNDLGSSYLGLIIWYGTGIFVRGNRSQSHIQINATNGSTGAVVDNYIESVNASLVPLLTAYVGNAGGPHLVVTGLFANWQIQNNKAYGQFIVIRTYEPNYAAYVQVVGNQAGTLVVGLFNNDTGAWGTTHNLSRMMVVGNFANLIRVNNYSNLMMSNNLAADIIVGTSSVGTVFGPVNNRDV